MRREHERYETRVHEKIGSTRGPIQFIRVHPVRLDHVDCLLDSVTMQGPANMTFKPLMFN